MLKKDVELGGVYKAMISGKMVDVKLLRESEFGGWEATNLRTGRDIRIKSAAKLRWEVKASKAPEVAAVAPKTVPASVATPSVTPVTVEEITDNRPSRSSRYSPEAIAAAKADKVAKTTWAVPYPPPKNPAPAVSTDAEGATAQAKLTAALGGRKLSTDSVVAGTLAAIPCDNSLRELQNKPNNGKKQPTAEQAEILRAVLRRDKTLVVTAGAGTGKTTTLRMIADTLRGNGQYTAFNTNLVNESKSKFEGTRVACNTTHSLAFRAVGKNYKDRLGGQRIKSYQVAKMLGIEDLEIQTGTKTVEENGKTVEKPTTRKLSAGYLAGQVMGAIARFCQSADTSIQGNHFRYIDGIDTPSPLGRTYDNNEKVREYLLPFAVAAWKDLSDPKGSLPFSHDHYVKVWQLNKPVIAADYILLDEAQDTAPVMLDVIRQQRCPVILVGDSAQQIYEWRGAVDALEAFPGAPVCYLSQSFRFGVAIANVANAILERITGIDLRLKGLPSIPSQVEEVAEPTCILCRTNAVAVATLLENLAAGKKPFLVGGGAGVIAFVEAAQSLQAGQPTNHPELACFESWTEVQEYSKLDEGEDLKLMVKLVDTFGCEKILTALMAMPEEKHADVTISTAHKSKGREWNHVRLANDFPTASKSSDADLKLLYVAVTRAKLTLDVSQCPFFTGQDSMDVAEIAARMPKELDGSPVGILPATPSTPPAPESYTWSKDDNTGAWLVKGPSGKKGEVVTVVRRDGSESTRRLLDVARQMGPVSFYKV